MFATDLSALLCVVCRGGVECKLHETRNEAKWKSSWGSVCVRDSRTEEETGAENSEADTKHLKLSEIAERKAREQIQQKEVSFTAAASHAA